MEPSFPRWGHCWQSPKSAAPCPESPLPCTHWSLLPGANFGTLGVTCALFSSWLGPGSWVSHTPQKPGLCLPASRAWHFQAGLGSPEHSLGGEGPPHLLPGGMEPWQEASPFGRAAVTGSPEAQPCTQELTQPSPPSWLRRTIPGSRSLSLGPQPGVQGAGPPGGPCHPPELQ